MGRSMVASPCWTSGSLCKLGPLARTRAGIGACSLGMRASAISTTACSSPPMCLMLKMRPSCWTVPVIFPVGHHMSVASSPVPSTVPCQMHMSNFMSTLVRVSVRVVASLSRTVSFAVPPSSASRDSAYSTIGGRGAATRPTPAVALEAVARSIIDFCLPVTFVPAGAE